MPTIFKFNASFLCALNKAFSDTGPNSMLATSASLTMLSLPFFSGNCFSFSKSLYDLSKLIVKSMLLASSVPAGKLTFSFLKAFSTS